MNIENLVGHGENWILISGIVTLIATFLYILSDPPLHGDLAYFAFFSSLVSDGHLIYTNSSMGYTPLGVIIPGYAFKIGDWLINDLTLYRALGIINLWFIIFFLFKTAILFFEKRIAFLIILTFLGLEVIGNISVIAFDPKAFVCLTTIVGFYLLLNDNYLFSSLLFAFGFWTWQPAGVNFLFLGIMIFKNYNFMKVIPVIIGFIVGSLPSLLYLLGTDQIGDFYQQSLFGRIRLGASNNPISPLKFLYQPFKYHQSDLLIYLSMFLGFFIPILRKRLDNQIKNLLILTSIWTLLFFKEYGYRDLIPFLGILIVWSGFLYEWVLVEKKINFKAVTFLLILVFYSDSFSNKGTFHNQMSEFRELVNNYDFQHGNYITLGSYSEGFSFINDSYTYNLLIRLNNYNIQKPTCDKLIQNLGLKIKYVVVDKPAILKERNFDCGNRVISIINKSKPIYESETLMVYEL